MNYLYFYTAKELERPIPLAEKLIPSKQAPTISAPVIPAPPPEVPSTDLPLIREEPKLTEFQVPVKKYYGRKRDSQSSSSENELSYDEGAADSIVKTK